MKNVLKKLYLFWLCFLRINVKTGLENVLIVNVNIF